MSHITKIAVAITSLQSLRDACTTLGFEFMEGQKQFVYYQGQKHKCDHAIRVPGATYEIGVVKQKDGTFGLETDFWSTGGLTEKIGQNGNLLTQQYKAQEVKRQMIKKGFVVSRSWIDEKSNSIQFEFEKRRF